MIIPDHFNAFALRGLQGTAILLAKVNHSSEENSSVVLSNWTVRLLGDPAWCKDLRHHYRARNWTFDENHFWSLLKAPFKTDLLVKTVWKIFSGEVGIKCHQSCLVALVFCTKLYTKLAISQCSFSQFLFILAFERLMHRTWNLAHFLSVVSSPILC